MPQFLLCLRYRFAVGAFSQCARDSRCWQHLCCCFILWTFTSSCHRRSLCNFLLSISAVRGLIPCSSLSLVIVSVASASSSLNYPALPRRHNWSLLQRYAWPCCACLLIRRFVHRVPPLHSFVVDRLSSVSNESLSTHGSHPVRLASLFRRRAPLHRAPRIGLRGWFGFSDLPPPSVRWCAAWGSFSYLIGVGVVVSETRAAVDDT